LLGLQLDLVNNDASDLSSLADGLEFALLIRKGNERVTG